MVDHLIGQIRVSNRFKTRNHVRWEHSKVNEDELDRPVKKWTINRSREAVMSMMRWLGWPPGWWKPVKTC